MKAQSHVLTRANALVEKGKKLLATAHREPGSFGSRSIDDKLFFEWKSQCEALIEQSVGPDHPFTRNFQKTAVAATEGCAENAFGVLMGFREDVENGALFRLEDLAHADVFNDILEQSEHLLDEGHHVPAAALVGATLESELRALLQRKNIPCTRQDSLATLNQKCVSAKLFNSVRSKEIEVWTKVRNNADHGHFSEVLKEDVKKMLDGVRSFLAEIIG